LSQLKETTPASVIKGIIEFLDRQGIQMKDPTPFLESYFCQEGILTQAQLSSEAKIDVAFGLRIAKKMTDLEVGQTVIIKDKTVVAVEGIEGTNAVIMRGARLAGEGTVVVKTGRSIQDARVDLPAVGVDTIRALVDAKSRALCLESQKVLFFQKEEATALADVNNISIVVKKM
jgi:DUF1009 family protein